MISPGRHFKSATLAARLLPFPALASPAYSRRFASIARSRATIYMMPAFRNFIDARAFAAARSISVSAFLLSNCT